PSLPNMESGLVLEKNLTVVSTVAFVVLQADKPNPRQLSIMMKRTVCRIGARIDIDLLSFASDGTSPVSHVRARVGQGLCHSTRWLQPIEERSISAEHEER